ncbi:MAG: hypothetical protein K8S98_15045 [Planctomycetes bacterium]|nr:hypothetical protein [Planctomycetota bacterium]
MSNRRGAVRSRLVGVVVLALVCGYVVYRALRSSSATRSAERSAEQVSPSKASEVELAEIGLVSSGDAVADRQAAHAPDVADSASLHVVDVDGRPIADAVAAVCAPGTRALDPQAATNLGTSDASGLVRISASWVREHAGATISVLHRDYAAASVSSDALQDGDERVVLMLALGLVCRVQCIDLDELPLPGVLVRASQAPFEGLTSLPTDLPSLSGSDEATRIHSAFSDSHGIATLSGLAPGSYSVSAYLEHFTMVLDRDDDFAFTAPTDAIKLVRLAPILAFVGRIEGDELLSSILEMRGDGIAFTGRVREELLRREKDRLEERFPGAIVVTAEPMSLTKPQPWRLHALFARHPAETFEFEPLPVDEITAPVSLRPTGELTPELPGGELVIVDANGRKVDVPGLFVEVAQTTEEFAVEVTANTTVRLPAGEYALQTYDSFFRALIPSTTLRVPGTTVITLDRVFRKCRLTLGDSGEARPHMGHIKVDVADCASKQVFLLDSARPVELWLPVGTVSIAFGVTDGESAARAFEVVASAENDVQEILLR